MLKILSYERGYVRRSKVFAMANKVVLRQKSPKEIACITSAGESNCFIKSLSLKNLCIFTTPATSIRPEIIARRATQKVEAVFALVSQAGGG